MSTVALRAPRRNFTKRPAASSTNTVVHHQAVAKQADVPMILVNIALLFLFFIGMLIALALAKVSFGWAFAYCVIASCAGTALVYAEKK